MLKKYDIAISMAEDYEPTDNAVVERFNLKQHNFRDCV